MSMYSRKSVGLRMEPWGTPTLTGYSCEDFSSRTTQICLLLRKEEISQTSDLKFLNANVCEEDGHAKPWEKLWLYQVLQPE